jgi:hypothetical protein
LGVAERIARRLYDGVATVEWVPSDEADVFRLTFCSGLEPRYLKLRAGQLVGPPCGRVTGSPGCVVVYGGEAGEFDA